MTDYFEECYSKACTAFSMERYDTVHEMCAKAREQSDTEAKLYSLEGNAYLVEKKLPEAESCYRKAIELDGTVGKQYFELGNSLFGQRKLSEAMEQYARAIQLGCDTDVQQKIYYLMALIDLESGRSKDALLNFEKSEKLPDPNPDEADILLRRIQIYVGQQDYENAERCAVKLNLLIPGDFKTYQLLYQIYCAQNEMDKAQKALYEASVRCTMSVENRVELGFDRAMLCCFQADRNPKEQTVYFKEALQHLQQVESIAGVQPKDLCESKITRAEIRMRLNEYEAAEKLLKDVEREQAPELAEYRERACYDITLCAEKLGKFDLVESYGKALKKSENLFYRHYGYYAEAFAVGRKAWKDSSLRKRSAELYQFAVAYYKNCSIASPGDFVAYLFRAKCYVDMGEYEKATEIGKVLPPDSQASLQAYIDESRRR